MIAAGKGFVKTAEGGACPAACARTGPARRAAAALQPGRAGSAGDRAEGALSRKTWAIRASGMNGTGAKRRAPACDFYKRAARKRGGALPRGRKLCYNKLL